MKVIGDCPARCGLTGGCYQCQPGMHMRPVFAPLRLHPVGWECPRCGTVHSPYTSSCGCAPPLNPFKLSYGSGS